MGNLNARMPGLVNYLDLITEGRAPGDISGQVQGQVDLSDFVLLGKRVRRISAAVAAGGAVGSFAFAADFTVPANEAWMLVAYAVTFQVPAGIGAVIAPAVQMQCGAGLQSFPLGAPFRSFQTVNTTSSFIHAENLPFLVPPGSIMGGITEELTGVTAFNATGLIDYVPIRL